jgi:hypothetical protein
MTAGRSGRAGGLAESWCARYREAHGLPAHWVIILQVGSAASMLYPQLRRLRTAQGWVTFRPTLLEKLEPSTEWAAVSPFCACIGSPCLRQCVHGAPIGAAIGRGGGGHGPCPSCSGSAGWRS